MDQSDDFAKGKSGSEGRDGATKPPPLDGGREGAPKPPRPGSGRDGAATPPPPETQQSEVETSALRGDGPAPPPPVGGGTELTGE